jgi:hypothetical protein
MDKSSDYVGQQIFTQVLSFIDDSLLQAACNKHNANKYSAPHFLDRRIKWKFIHL